MLPYSHSKLRALLNLRPHARIHLLPPREVRRSVSLQRSGEVSLALLQKRIDAFGLVGRRKHVEQDGRVEQVGGLGGVRAAPHQHAVEVAGERSAIRGDVGGEGEGAVEHGVGRVADLLEEAGEVRRGRREGAARGQQVARCGEADEARQEEGRARLHGDAAAREHEAVLGFAVADADGGRQRHRHAQAYR